MNWLAILLNLPYFFLLMMIWWRLRSIRPFCPVTVRNLFVTVVISCRNEAEHIYRLLHKISQQEYPGDSFEVIVIDDNSTDGTFERVLDFTGINNLRVIKNEGQGKKRAIRNGIAIASGTLIITTDGDCAMGPRWMSTIVAFFEDNRPDMIIGQVMVGSIPGFFGRFQELEFLSLQGVTAGSALAGMSTMCNGANLAFTKEAYLQHADRLRYDISSGDDIFLLHNLKKEKEVKIMWLESVDSMVTASPAITILPFLNQRNRWISKGKAYKDKTTIILAIVTFVTIFAQAFFLVAGFFVPEFLLTFLIVLGIKSVPDFMILNNTTARYGKKELMKWFLPSQLAYPFYVLAVILVPVLSRKR